MWLIWNSSQYSSYNDFYDQYCKNNMLAIKIVNNRAKIYTCIVYLIKSASSPKSNTIVHVPG